MNQNISLAGCGEEASDILEIPSDSERRAATDGGATRREGGYVFRRPASFRIFRRRADTDGYDDGSADGSVDTNLRTVMMSQSAGEDPEECKIAAIDVQKKEGDIYNISSHDDEQIDPLSND